MSEQRPLDPQRTVDHTPAADEPSTVDATGAWRSTSLNRRSPDPPIDAPTIPGYAVTAEIARGGMGRVYAAVDLSLDREVAIKRLLPGADADRFVTESKIAAKLPHPGIPPVHAIGVLEDGSPYLVMKFIRGRTLADLLNHRSSPAEELPRFVQIFEQIAQAVGFAHEQGVIHRDLKPLNVMVGEFGEVQVMDWGLAKDLASPGRQARGDGVTPNLTHTFVGTVMGTPGYMSPEQARGEPADARSDVFALGAILAAILTGKPAFVGSTAMETIDKSAHADLSDVHARLHASGADPELVALSKRCLAAKADGRLADGRTVAKAAAAYRANVERRLRRAETDAAEARIREAEQKKRRRVLLSSACAVALVLAVGLGISLWQMNRAITAEIQARFDRDAKGTALESEKAARASEKLARDRALTALKSLTDEIVENQMARGTTLTEESKEFLRKIVEQFEGFAAITGDDRESRLIRAEGLARVGSMRHRLGQHKEAESAMREALAIRETLVAESPHDAAVRYTLAVSHNNLGNLMVDVGRPKDAVKGLNAALTILKALVDDHPTEGGYQRQLASVHNNLAIVHRDAGRLKEAESHWREAIPIYKETAEQHPTRPQLRQELAGSSSALAGLLVETGRLSDAEATFRDVLKVQERLVADFPSRAEFRDELATTHNSLAGLLMDTDRPKDADASYQAAIKSLRELAVEFPVDPRFRHKLARSLYNRAILLAAQEQTKDAESQYTEALDIRKKITEHFPGNPEYRSEHADVYNGLGLLYKETNRPKEAESAYRNALAIRKKLVDDFPGHATYRSDFASIQNNLALLLSNTGREAEAEAAYNEALGVQKKMAVDFPEQPELQNAAAGAFVNMGFLLIGRGEFAKAKARVEEAAPFHAAALKANSRHPRFRDFYRNHLAAMTMARAGLHEPTESQAAAKKLCDLGWDPPADAYFAARALATATSIVQKHKNLDAAARGAESKALADQAMVCLREAVKHGFDRREQLKNDGNLAPLRQREDFKKLVAELEAKSKKPAAK